MGVREQHQRHAQRKRDRRDRQMAATGEFYCKHCCKTRKVEGGTFVLTSHGRRDWRCAICLANSQPPTPIPDLTPGVALRRPANKPLSAVLAPFIERRR